MMLVKFCQNNMSFVSTVGKIAIFWQLWMVALCYDHSGFIFTAPKTFLSDHEENVCITLKNNSNISEVKVRILHLKEDVEIALAVEKITAFDYDGKCFKIFIPKTKVKKARLQLTVRLKTEGDLNINYVQQIFIQTNPDITFIQTDKPVYNGGQLLRFKIFTLKSDLTPATETIEKIWIENPSGIHLMQWLNESIYHGVANYSFQLSEEPMFGKWFVKMKKKDKEAISHSFLVENYVLPKFSVVIKSPKYINTTGNITICAKYHFGEPVNGEVTIKYFVKCTFSYYCQEDKSAVTHILKLDYDGCVNHDIVLKNPSNFAHSLILNATVTESGTYVKEKAFSNIKIHRLKKRNLPEFSFETTKKKFKPGLPFKGQVTMNTEGEGNENVVVCLDSNELKSCREISLWKYKSDFIVMPLNITDEKSFKAAIKVRNSRDSAVKESYEAKLNLVPWYSPSHNYLLIEKLSGEVFRCKESTKFNILYRSSDKNIRFHYLIKSRGAILSKGNLDKFSESAHAFQYEEELKPINKGDLTNVRQFEFSLNITSNMAPRPYLLVYFIRDDGEVVADTLALAVEKCLPNKVKTKWDKTVTPPGSDNTFSIETTANSICSLVIKDKSVNLFSHENEINSNKVYNEFEKFEISDDLFNENPSNHCKEDEGLKDQFLNGKLEQFSAPKPMDSRFVDSFQAFKDFGVLVITDFKLETRPCRVEDEDEKYITNVTRNSKTNVLDDRIENISIFEAQEFPDSDELNFRESPLAYEIRTYFPETWIWDLIHIRNSGLANLNLKAPHTITEWIASTVCLSPQNGLGVAEHSRLTTYQPFFLYFLVPHSLHRKEIFHLSVSVFNYESAELPVKVTYISTASFISKSDESASYCIRPKSKIVHRFVLEAQKLGEAKIAVKAEVDSNYESRCGNVVYSNSDVVIKTTYIKHEGFLTEEVKSGFICSENSNFDDKVDWNIKIPADVVESSIAVDALVSGDILGPSLRNIDHLISLPTGCGEQNMILLVPNILLLDYLLLTKPNNLEPIEKALQNLDLGYQRQLNYRRRDGSYSAFGEQDGKGSIWLTAFVVRYLSQAKKYIHIDTKNLNLSVSWITKHQLENGCFPMIGKIYHRKLQEKLLEGDSSKTLSAYILISLIEAGIPKDNPVIKNTIYCLKPTHESLGVYGDLLLSYALILAGEYRDSQTLMLEQLKEAKRTYGMLWWESDDSIESSIEMTSYGILALVKLGGSHFLAAAADALRWIIQHQNQNGGFVSSQDTVLALEAISKFSATLPQTNNYDLLTITASTLDKKYIFNISDSNRMLQQKVSLPPFLTSVHFRSNGKGCALVKTSLRYHVKRGKPSNDLKVQLKIQSASDVDSYSIAKFHICIRYKSGKDKINMAVLEVAMVSGYYPDRSSLYEIQTSRKGVRRWEEYEDKVNFYFEDLKNKKVCVKFLVVQEACVENTMPALIKLYDYYNTQRQISVKYSLTPKCENESWSNISYNKIKQESKRDLREEDLFSSRFSSYEFNDGQFEDFSDFEEDLDTPSDYEGVMPVFALPPNPKQNGSSCLHCLTVIPEIFPKLYCSSQIAIKVLILGNDIIQFDQNFTPRTNFTYLKRSVSYTKKKECECSILSSANSYALLMVTPPRTFNIYTVREIHLDDSVQLYPWGESVDTPRYLINAINYCREWLYGRNY